MPTACESCAGETEVDFGMALTEAAPPLPEASQEAWESGKVGKTKTQVGVGKRAHSRPSELLEEASSGQARAVTLLAIHTTARVVGDGYVSLHPKNRSWGLQRQGQPTGHYVCFALY
jgi:hypothetical protein